MERRGAKGMEMGEKQNGETREWGRNGNGRRKKGIGREKQGMVRGETRDGGRKGMERRRDETGWVREREKKEGWGRKCGKGGRDGKGDGERKGTGEEREGKKGMKNEKEEK